MSFLNNTIVAIATPIGRGGIGIIRLSGSQALSIAEKITGRLLIPPRYACYAKFLDADKSIIDDGIVIYFPAPYSFTGEDVVELQGHGGLVVMNLLLERVLNLGARLARPGEFSERAFLNDKIDLIQAEAIVDVIDAVSSQAVRHAMRTLQGEFSQRIYHLVQGLIHLRAHIEATLDFPEEEIDFLADKKISEQLESLSQELEKIFFSAKQGAILREGLRAVIAGKPNVGKSSLLNRLTGRESAIVTDIAGTTRDVLREVIQLDGIPLHVIDTAGLRESSDPVEQEGVKRARQEIEQADVILFIVDVNQKDSFEKNKDFFQLPIKKILVENKIDLLKRSASFKVEKNYSFISLSAKTGEGIDLLKQELKKLVGYQENTEGQFIARQRHLQSLQRAQEYLTQGKKQLLEHCAGELLAQDLLQAQQALNEITGEFTSNDLLGEIFSRFCIGK